MSWCIALCRVASGRGEDFGATVGDEYGVFGLGAPPTVHRAARPLVRPQGESGLALHEHRL